MEKSDYKSNKIFVSRTGYTGELGFELLGDHKIINDNSNFIYSIYRN